MPNTYTQVHIHSVFTVANRESLISTEWKGDLYKYIGGIIKENTHKSIIINGTDDHVHILFGMRPNQSLSEIMQKIKANSSKWINEKRFTRGKFEWQSGYGAFSYSKSQLPMIIDYIAIQEQHHKKKSFIDEYKELLCQFDIEYDDKYIFTEIE